ncbi:MAG TPA: hypothetical protein VIJ62_07145 [Rhizomicrobium sp.]
MSEQNNMRRANIRWKLMTTASALALCVSFYGADRAVADTDRPTIWIDLGGQLEWEKVLGDPNAVPFASDLVADGFMSPLKAGRELGQSFGGEGAISYQPEDSNWIFSASMRYGRASGGTATHQQTPDAPKQLYIGTFPLTALLAPPFARYSDMRVANSESHAILDFQAGRDLGLGLFGDGGQSEITAGVRIAQFHTKQSLGMHADPDAYLATNLKYGTAHHTYSVNSLIERSFHGLGPSLSWTASAPVAGSADENVTLEWGINAALLFGKQKVRGHHETNGQFYTSHRIQKYRSTSPIHRSGNPDRSRTVTVPNIGGFAGVSYVFPNAKLSVGYRADFFFGAMDGGIDAAKKENVGFYGPFATVSVGLGG